ncbi:hypothetical protein K6025_00250 [Ehrlichia sp. JZT12]
MLISLITGLAAIVASGVALVNLMDGDGSSQEKTTSELSVKSARKENKKDENSNCNNTLPRSDGIRLRRVLREKS